MTGIETALMIGGTLLSAGTSIIGGMSANQQAKAQARQVEEQARQERAAALREAGRKRKEGEYIQSQQLAAAAAGGGGVNDPTVLNIMGDTAGETEIQAKELQYAGDVRATDLMNTASMIRYGGKQEKMGGLVKGLSSLAAGGASIYNKYNPASTTSRYDTGASRWLQMRGGGKSRYG